MNTHTHTQLFHTITVNLKQFTFSGIKRRQQRLVVVLLFSMHKSGNLKNNHMLWTKVFKSYYCCAVIDRELGKRVNERLNESSAHILCRIEWCRYRRKKHTRQHLVSKAEAFLYWVHSQGIAFSVHGRLLWEFMCVVACCCWVLFSASIHSHSILISPPLNVG